MRKILAVAWKECVQAGRDPLTLAMLLGIPAMMLLLYGYALNFDVRHVELAVDDQDRSSESRALIDEFAASTYFDVRTARAEETHELFGRRAARGLLVIPDGFGRALARGEGTTVQLLMDGADASTATTALGYASGLIAQRNVRLLSASPLGFGSLAHAIPLAPRIWYNPDLRSTRFLVPGLIGFILMLTAVLSTALSVVREKERGTMEQLRVTSLGPGQLLLGKTLPYLVISLAATAIILIAARLLFDVAVLGSYLDLFAATFIYLIGALGMGLLVSSWVKSQAMAFQVGTFVSMLPSIFLSGFIFPIPSMPAPIQWLTYAIPARHFLVVLRGVMLKGSTLEPFGAPLAYLAIYAVLVLGIAWFRLTREKEIV